MLGLEQFQRARYADALGHFQAASRLDSTFALPLVWSAFAYGNSGRRAETDSVVGILDSRREQLGPLDRAALDYFLAGKRDDFAAERDAIRRAEQLAPGSEWSHNASNLALAMNRPREALQYLRAIDPENGWVKTWVPYWLNLFQAHHLLGEYEMELEASRRAGRLDPTSAGLRLGEVRALIALNRVDEAAERVEEILLLPAAPGTPTGQALLTFGEELRAHGHPQRAMDVLRQAEMWLRSPASEAWVRLSDPADQDSLPILRWWLGEVLYAAGRWEEAEVHFRQLAAEDSTLGVARAYVGLLAARRGDRAEAERAIRFLSQESVRWGQSSETDPRLARAQIAGLLGDRERAVEHLRVWVQTNRQPRGHVRIHRARDWEALQGYAPFEALVRSRN